MPHRPEPGSVRSSPSPEYLQACYRAAACWTKRPSYRCETDEIWTGNDKPPPQNQDCVLDLFSGHFHPVPPAPPPKYRILGAALKGAAGSRYPTQSDRLKPEHKQADGNRRYVWGLAPDAALRARAGSRLQPPAKLILLWEILSVGVIGQIFLGLANPAFVYLELPCD